MNMESTFNCTANIRLYGGFQEDKPSSVDSLSSCCNLIYVDKKTIAISPPTLECTAYNCDCVCSCLTTQEDYYKDYVLPSINKFINDPYQIEKSIVFVGPSSCGKSYCVKGISFDENSQRDDFSGLYTRIFSDFIAKDEICNIKSSILIAASNNQVYSLLCKNSPVMTNNMNSIDFVDCSKCKATDGKYLLKLSAKKKDCIKENVEAFSEMYIFDLELQKTVSHSQNISQKKRLILIEAKIFSPDEIVLNKRLQKFSIIDPELQNTITKILSNYIPCQASSVNDVFSDSMQKLTKKNDYLLGIRDNLLTNFIKRSFDNIQGSIDFWYCLPTKIISTETFKTFTSTASFIGKFKTNVSKQQLANTKKDYVNNISNDNYYRANTIVTQYSPDNNDNQHEYHEASQYEASNEKNNRSCTNDNMCNNNSMLEDKNELEIKSFSEVDKEEVEENENEQNIGELAAKNDNGTQSKNENEPMDKYLNNFDCQKISELEKIIQNQKTVIDIQTNQIKEMQRQIKESGDANHTLNIKLMESKRLAGSLIQQTINNNYTDNQHDKTVTQWVPYGSNSMSAKLQQQQRALKEDISTICDFNSYVSSYGVKLSETIPHTFSKTSVLDIPNKEVNIEAHPDAIVEDCLVSLALKEEEISKLTNELVNLRNIIDPLKEASRKMEQYCSEVSLYKGLTIEKEDNIRRLETDLFNISNNLSRKQERVIELEEKIKLVEDELAKLKIKDLNSDFYQKRFYQSEVKLKEVTLSMRAVEAENTSLRDTILSKDNQIASMAQKLSYFETKQSVMMEIYSNNNRLYNSK